MAIKTYAQAGSLGAGGQVLITATPGYVRFLSPTSINSTQTLSVMSSRTDTTFALNLRDVKTYQVATETVPLTLRSVASSTFFLSGDEVLLGEAGGIEGVISTTSSAASDVTQSADIINYIPNKALEFTALAVSDSTNFTLSLRDASTKVRIADLKPVTGSTASFYPFVLWPELNMELYVRYFGAATAVTGYGFGRAVQYDSATMYESSDKLLVDVTLPSNTGTYNLQPPVGEIWYVDTWLSSLPLGVYINGTGSSIAQNNARYRLSNETWIQFRNAQPSQVRLIVVGVKGTAI